MELINEKVSHRSLGAGTIIGVDDQYITIQFESKTSKVTYPTAFETILKLDNTDKQEAILAEINRTKKAEAEKKRIDEEMRKNDDETRKAALSATPPDRRRAIKMNIDDMFSEDYHAEHLERQPILNYKQVENQFGIQISGFGRGINPTATIIVLISSIDKDRGKFVYHDRWTSEGDYIYSGEGKTGDQTMTKGNYAIKNSAHDDKKIHLFVKFSPQEYYYQGVFYLVDISYEDEKDEDGNTRKEYKFRLRKVQ